MKYLLCAFIICLASIAFSQTPFEGRIIYKATGTEKKDSGILTIYFGKPGVRLELREAKRPEKDLEAIIINLDSGKVYTLNPGDMKYKESVLQKKAPKSDLLPKTIAGFKTTPVVLEFSSVSPIASILKEPVLYVSSDLYYPLQDVYVGNLELAMVQKNKIVLGADFFIEDHEDWNLNEKTEKKKNIFTVFATSVTAEKLEPALFQIPAAYTNRALYDYSTDSTAAAYDTVMVYPIDTAGLQQYQPPVKKKKSSPKKKPAIKQQATRRKHD